MIKKFYYSNLYYYIYYKTNDANALNIDTSKFGVTFVEDQLVNQTTGQRRLVFISSPTKIGDSSDTTGVFENCTSLISIDIPNTVTSIGTKAFHGCDLLTNIIIPDSVTVLYNGSFWDCPLLEHLVLGNGITEINLSAFNNCSSLTDITCSANIPPTISSSTFSNVSTSIPVYVPSGSVSAYQAAFEWSNFTNIQAIPLQ